MKLKLKRDIVIPAGTVMSSDGVPTKTTRDPLAFVAHLIDFGKNATGEIMIGHEVGDPEFDEWFEVVK
jgi:hypothetical protein